MSTKRPLVAVVGDARVSPGSPKDRMAEELGRLLIDHGYRLLTGGMGGVMEASSRGARASERYLDGDIVGIVPGHDPATANPYVDIAIASGLDHGRNLIVAHADAVIAVGGGAGTLTEMAFAWIHKRLVVAMRVEGWSGKLADHRIDERVRYPEIADDRVFGAHSPTDVVTLLDARLHQFRGNHREIARRP